MGVLRLRRRIAGAAARTSRWLVSWCGAALLLAAVVEEVVFAHGADWALTNPPTTALLTYASIAAAIGLATLVGRWVVEASRLASVAWQAALATSLAATGLLIAAASVGGARFEAIHWIWLAVVWAAIAWATGWRPLWTLVQAALAASAVFAAVARLEHEAWFREARDPWLDPWTLETLGIALAALGLAWVAARFAVKRASARRPLAGRLGRAADVLASPWLLGDRAVTAALLGLVVLLAGYAAVPGARQELAPRRPPRGKRDRARPKRRRRKGPLRSPSNVRATCPRAPISNARAPHAHAGGRGGWQLWAGVLLLVAATVMETCSPGWLLALLVAAAASVPLAASGWEEQVAVASALRWLSVAYLVAASAAIWCRRTLAAAARRVGWHLRGVEWNVAATACALRRGIGDRGAVGGCRDDHLRGVCADSAVHHCVERPL